MPDPSTTRLGMYKSASDGSEDVDYTQDIGQNLDKIDAAVGFASCTSSTRPSSPYSGKPIMETDTSYRTFFSNGTSPASASWVEIPNGSAQYNSTLRLASGKQIVVNGSTSGATIAVVNAAAGTDLLSARVTGDTQDRFEIETDGTLNWGAGGASATDVTLYRPSANVLRTGDSLTVDLNLTVSGSAALTGNLAVSSTAALNATSGAFTTYSNNTFSTFVPNVTNSGTATWTTRTGWYMKIGKMVYVAMHFVVNAAGSGASTVAIDAPSTLSGATDQILLTHFQAASTRVGYTVKFSGSDSVTLDRVRVQDGGAADTVSNLTGAMLTTGAVLVIQGWYREA
ncbi:hypothetical protein ACFCYX_19595 [Streptomyces populi]|uniref:hypothetical protein n=1 Tax=Streptomyces populi TaxID=2058924 RepID=UPI0035D5FD60